MFQRYVNSYAQCQNIVYERALIVLELHRIGIGNEKLDNKQMHIIS